MTYVDSSIIFRVEKEVIKNVTPNDTTYLD